MGLACASGADLLQRGPPRCSLRTWTADVLSHRFVTKIYWLSTSTFRQRPEKIQFVASCFWQFRLPDLATKTPSRRCWPVSYWRLVCRDVFGQFVIWRRHSEEKAVNPVVALNQLCEGLSQPPKIYDMSAINLSNIRPKTGWKVYRGSPAFLPPVKYVFSQLWTEIFCFFLCFEWHKK